VSVNGLYSVQVDLVPKANEGAHRKARVAGQPEGFHAYRSALADKGDPPSLRQGSVAVLYENRVEVVFRNEDSQ
jgi:hypothetical protein